MNDEELIAIEVFCAKVGVETTFVLALQDRGLVEFTVQEESYFVAVQQLPRLEQLARMYYDLEINLEGIEALSHMLERVQGMQQELQELRDRLALYEEPGGR